MWFREDARINIKPGQYATKMNYFMSGSDYLATPHFSTLCSQHPGYRIFQTSRPNNYYLVKFYKL